MEQSADYEYHDNRCVKKHHQWPGDSKCFGRLGFGQDLTREKYSVEDDRTQRLVMQLETYARRNSYLGFERHSPPAARIPFTLVFV